MQIQRLFTIAALLTLPWAFTQCASTDEPVGNRIENLGHAVDEHLPGLGSNPTTEEDRFHR